MNEGTSTVLGLDGFSGALLYSVRKLPVKMLEGSLATQLTGLVGTIWKGTNSDADAEKRAAGRADYYGRERQ